MELIFATSNKGKLKEAQEILGDGYSLSTPSDYGITEDIPETGATLADNSFQKAEYIVRRLRDCLDVVCFADDTGLEVDALGGAPGIYTARYAGPGHDFDANIDKLLSELDKCPEGTPRTARFRCVVTLVTPQQTIQFEGLLEGRIALRRSGSGGFGYDPVFIADDYPDRTLSEISEEAKNAISHRGKALREMTLWIKQNL